MIIVQPEYSLIAGVLNFARAEVGVREKGGPNRGKRIEMYQAAAGGRPGDAYCVAGIYWCFQQSAMALRTINPMPRTTGALRLYELAPAYAKLPPWRNSGQKTPQPGAIVVHRSKSKPGRGHVGLVVHTRGAEIGCIEFNTNPAGSRDGDGVYIRERPTEYWDVGIIDFALPAHQLGDDDLTPTVNW